MGSAITWSVLTRFGSFSRIKFFEVIFDNNAQTATIAHGLGAIPQVDFLPMVAAATWSALPKAYFDTPLAADLTNIYIANAGVTPQIQTMALRAIQHSILG